VEAPPDFEHFYLTHFETVARVIYMTTRSREEAVDIAQEAFVRTWARWGRLRRSRDPLPFTLTVARNLATSRVRQLIRHRRAMATLPANHPPDEPITAGLEVREALADLPHRQRWAVVLCDLMGLPSPEAASIMGVSPSTLRVHLARARGHLRRALSEHEAAEVAPQEPPSQRR
jgi:RNA polymerase sigma-70 factor (ECF subfamily)